MGIQIVDQVKSISNQKQELLQSFRIIFNEQQRMAVAKWDESWVEFIDFDQKKSMFRDFKKKFSKQKDIILRQLS